MENEKQPQIPKWYKKWWVIIMCIILFIITLPIAFPVLMIWLIGLMWVKGKWSKKTRITITAVPIVLILLTVIAGLSSRGTPSFTDLPQKTTQQNITVKGDWVQGNADVKIFLNNNLFSEVKADKDGNFEAPITLNEGDNMLYAIASYKNGEKKSSEAKITYINQAKIDAQNKADADAKAAADAAQQKATADATQVAADAAQQKAADDAKAAADAAQQKADADAAQQKADADAAQQKAADDAKAAADAAKQKIADDAQAAADAAQNEKDFKASSKSISYALLEKDSSPYLGEDVHFKGKIDQAGTDSGSDWFRIAVTSMGYGIYTDDIWVTSDKTDFVTGDIVNFWGTVSLPYCYTSQANFNICIPSVNANYISK